MALPLSIIIPTRNEEKYLPRLLEAIKRQTARPMEIIVADNHSDDRTVEIAKSYGCIIVLGGKHPSIGRNSGARHATQPYLLFFDADVQIQDDFLEKNLDEFMQRGLGVASCLTETDSTKFIDKAGTAVNNLYYITTERFIKNAGGFCIFAKKAIHERIGGFDETLLIAEDQDYAVRASHISKYRFLRSRKVVFSLRRYEVEGKVKLFLKYLKIYYYTTFKGKLKEGIIPYSFSHEYGKEKKNEEVKKSASHTDPKHS
jgi:glycosyltransferase involved in cell wall biosynthesis